MKTKLNLVKDIFYATDIVRTIDNYIEGMAVIETMAHYNYKSVIAELHANCFENDILSPNTALRRLNEITIHNIPESSRIWYKLYWKRLNLK